MAEPTRVWQKKYVTYKSKTLLDRSGRAVKRDVPTDFEETYRMFLTLNP